MKKIRAIRKIEIKDGQLITKDKEGKEWRVLWSLEPVSQYQISWGTGPKNIKILSLRIFYLWALRRKQGENNSAGKTFYTKDGSIIVEDKLNYDKDIIKVKKEAKVPKERREEFEKAYEAYKKK